MHAQPPRTLKRLLKQYGQELINDPRRTEALLRDHCGQHTREIFVLVNAQKQRVPSELRDAPTWMPRRALYTRLSRMLQTKLALTEDAADWAVKAWASALDLDSPPKGEAWSWLPSQLRAPAPKSSRKPRNKKRQNSPSNVQYPKVSASEDTRRSSSRKARGRAARAEMGWALPRLQFAIPDFLWRMPIAWANLLPWIALLAATIFLLAVVYWTSSTREPSQLGNQTNTYGTAVAQNNQTRDDINVTPINSNVTPLPNLPAPPSDYLRSVVTLPAWANVNVVTLYVRQQPTIDSDILNFLPKGEPVEVVAFSADGAWSQIERPLIGWVSNDFLLFKSQDATQTSILLDVHLRRTPHYDVAVRTAPFANADIMATLSPNKSVVVAAVMGEPASWYQIADPVIGWVAANDLASLAP